MSLVRALPSWLTRRRLPRAPSIRPSTSRYTLPFYYNYKYYRHSRGCCYDCFSLFLPSRIVRTIRSDGSCYQTDVSFYFTEIGSWPEGEQRTRTLSVNCHVCWCAFGVYVPCSPLPLGTTTTDDNETCNSPHPLGHSSRQG